MMELRFNLAYFITSKHLHPSGSMALGTHSLSAHLQRLSVEQHLDEIVMDVLGLIP